MESIDFNNLVENQKVFNFEIHAKHPVTLDRRWNRQNVSVLAESKRQAKIKLRKKYPLFDCIIEFNYETTWKEQSKEFLYPVIEGEFYQTGLKPIDTNFTKIYVDKRKHKTLFFAIFASSEKKPPLKPQAKKIVFLGTIFYDLKTKSIQLWSPDVITENFLKLYEKHLFMAFEKERDNEFIKIFNAELEASVPS